MFESANKSEKSPQ